MKDTLDDRYARVDDYASRVKGLEFSSQIWSVFAQLAEPRSGSEIATALSLSPDVVKGALNRLFESKLIRKEVLGWNEFAAAAKPPAPASSAPAKSASAAPGAKPGAKPAPAPSSPVSTGKSGRPAVSIAPASNPTTPAVVFLRLGSERALKSPSTPLVNLRLGGPAVAAESCAPWKLRPILDAIGARAGGGVAGQLLVYKVFLQLPPDLLKAAGLESLSVVDDRFTVTHPSLRAALIEAARRHADIDISSLLAA